MQRSSFVPLSEQQGAILDYCTAAKALQDVASASKASLKAARERQRRHREQVVESLRRLGGSCVEVRLPNGQPGYARLVQRRGGQKRLTAAAFAQALRGLTPDDVRHGCTPSGITRAAMDKMRGDPKEEVVVTKTPSPQVQVARLPATNTSASAYEQARHDLREILTAKRETSAPLKERCDRSRDGVLTHLRAHAPERMQQHVRVSQGVEDSTYVLKARSIPSRASRGDTVREAELAVAAALGDRAMAPSETLSHLQSEATLSFVDGELRRRLERLKNELQTRARLDVSFAVVK